jgi:hypothetical protein
MNTFALIFSYFLPRRIKYYAMLDWMDDYPERVITVECPTYILRIEKIHK